MYKFAGIQRAVQIGKYDVQETGTILKKLAYSYFRLMKIEAAHVPARMNWHFKAGLAGYEWFTQPQFKGDYDPHTKKTLAAAYVWLSVGVEGDAMKKDSMPAESRRLKELAGKVDDPAVRLLAQCIDFDWADEVTHHQYGRKWSADLLGDEETARRIADRENLLNYVRSAKDTIEYWQGKDDLIGNMYVSYFQQFMVPELLKEIETNG